ncbi:CNH-domain-containing protein [Microstroma glucosiphilum]|uniref:CNH-domain-containing protein n=1 Tax=Pseudomicrostroma glucosiphilum TaxID=1684307 RepID=A0A316UCF0_9BASI|nr:CNH-domain-containing protein [Pseudomicrostroma glucosiphilum]PWN22900.1 CNH-domain-containing protein [Pseudomicrostroma glucosiphilum]
MQFLRSKLAVVCARGFEIMNLDTLLPGTVPDFTRSPRDDPRILALARRVETAKPLGMFKLPDGESFLLCYDAFACYVDRGGEPIRLDNIVEWEGSPASVAFSSPYILGMDSRFVEIREAATGRLVQVIRGHDVRYVSACSVVEGSLEAEPSIICVQRRRAPQGKGFYDEQVVFELVQTNPASVSVAAEGRREPFKLRQAVEMGAAAEQQQRMMQRANLQRADTNATAFTSTSNGSSGALSYSSTMSSTRSGAGGGGGAGRAGMGQRSVTGSPSSAFAQRTPTMRAQGSRGALPGSSAPAPAGWI